ncbi:hypothetical protein AG1IA_10056 [Rhizoctonia solani AG-1 IA]|uniref:Uncharacterized protein n=1 Tax=Thanatephorus cucumeris (strain AG1-IA) TaxID=983506 RepID=L8WHR1_THACA|nr:hypothetical protein AG1IA_10056 [Rhizoctonia solani AG-1 IA]
MAGLGDWCMTTGGDAYEGVCGDGMSGDWVGGCGRDWVRGREGAVVDGQHTQGVLLHWQNSERCAMHRCGSCGDLRGRMSGFIDEITALMGALESRDHAARLAAVGT